MKLPVALALLTLAVGCSLPVTGRGPTPVACCAVPGAEVEITYLGVGGWVIRRGDVAVLSAPLFTDPSLFSTGLLPIDPDSARIDGMLDTLGVDLSDVSAILSGHGHYDHLMDVPWVMTRHATRARFLLNRTSAHQIAAWRLQDRLVVVDDSAGDARTAGHWIHVGDGLRVMPLRSAHAPQFAGIQFYQGRRDRDMERRPRTATEWLDGEAFAYLVDFLEGGRVVFRLYYQDAVAEAPLGFVADSILRQEGPDGRRVDVAILVPSTYPEVNWQPEALIDHLRPRHVLLGHWEDLFRSPFKDPKPLPINDFGHFLTRLDRALSAVGSDARAWHLPVAGARFLVR